MADPSERHSLVGPGKLVTKSNLLMHPIADGLHTGPPFGDVAEELPSHFTEPAVNLAIAAG